jgi:hypothetical protein
MLEARRWLEPQARRRVSSITLDARPQARRRVSSITLDTIATQGVGELASYSVR